LTGVVRHVWPKLSSRVLSVSTFVTPICSDGTGSDLIDIEVDSITGKVEK
jgi:hypothetical protein